MSPHMVGAGTLLAFAALLVAAGARVSSYAESAPPAFSGGFGEQSCHACHFEADPNTGPGRLTVAGVPNRFVPGERYPLTITLTRPAMKLAGFQMTARFEEGGVQAGALAPAAGEEGRLGIDIQGGIQYANQRREGAALMAPDTATWSLVWIAPNAMAPVIFHVSANAANADERADGDDIHTAAVNVAPESSAQP